MKNSHQKLFGWEDFFVFIFSVCLFVIARLLCENCLWISSLDTITANYIAKASVFGENPISYDSRFFLLPLQIIMQIFLNIFSFLRHGENTALIISIIFSAGISSLIVSIARRTSIKPVFRWVLFLIYLFHPLTFRSALLGSGIPVLIFFLMIVFSSLGQWKTKNHWLSLVWIGIGSAFAVITQLNAIIFIIIPVLAAVIIALSFHPKNYFFTENALWIIITPIAYVFMIRFFFSLALTNNPLNFFHYELLNNFLIDRNYFQIQLPISNLFQFLAKWIQTIWKTYPPFVIISILMIGLSIIKRKMFPIIFTLALWIPLLIIQTGIISGNFAPLSILSFSMVPFTILLIIQSAYQLSRNQLVFYILVCTSLIAYNLKPFQLNKSGQGYQFQEIGAHYIDTHSANSTAAIIENLGISNIFVADAVSIGVPSFSKKSTYYITPLNSNYMNLYSSPETFKGYILTTVENWPKLRQLLRLNENTRSISTTYQIEKYFLLEIR